MSAASEPSAQCASRPEGPSAHGAHPEGCARECDRPLPHRRGHPGDGAPQGRDRVRAAARAGLGPPAVRGRGRRPVRGGTRRRRADDAAQHGPAAPVDPRRAAPDARAAGRRGAAHQADHRLPAHGHGEDGRDADLPPGRDQHDPHGLRGAAVQRAGLLPGHRDAARHRRRHPAAGAVDPHAAVRAEPHVVAPAVPRHQRHGPRRRVDDDLRLARAGRDAAAARDDHGPADEPQLHPRRRRGRRPARRLARRHAARPRPRRAPARGVRGADDRPADLARAPAGRRGDHRRRGHRPRRHRSDPALDRRAVGPAQGRPVPVLRPGRVRRGRRRLRRLLRPLRHPPQRGPRVHGDRPADPREAAGRRLPHPGPQGHPAAAWPHRRVDGGPDPPLQDLHRGLQGARGRGLPGDREPPRRARLLHGQRRQRHALPHAHPGAVLREPAVDAAHAAGRPDRRRGGGHLLGRPDHGRGAIAIATMRHEPSPPRTRPWPTTSSPAIRSRSRR